MPIPRSQDLSCHQERQDCLVQPLIPHVELSFKVFGRTLPIDHGYGLFAALSHLQPEIHRTAEIGIQSIVGEVDREKGWIQLVESSRLRVRLHPNQIPLVYPLAGQAITIGKHRIRLGIPEICLIGASRNLYSRITVIKGHQEPDEFLQAAQRQLDRLGIPAQLRIAARANGTIKRKTIKIGRYTVAGFGLEILDLEEEDSIRLQTYGIGGKRKMGCGIFVPMKEQW